MKTIGIIQARSQSSRLPNKVLAPLAQRPLLSCLFRRVAQSSGVESWWLATTTEAADDVLAEWGKALGLKVFRGSVDDVLGRFLCVLEREPADRVVRLTADNPFTNGHTIDEALSVWDAAGCDFEAMADNVSCAYPLGFAPHIVTAASLRQAALDIPDDQSWHRIHAGLSWIFEHGRCSAWPAPPEGLSRPDWRWTVDTSSDLSMAQQAYVAFGDRWHEIGYRDMVAILDDRPDITALNSEIKQKQANEG